MLDHQHYFLPSLLQMHWPELHALFQADTNKFKDENDCSDTTELDQDIEAGQSC